MDAFPAHTWFDPTTKVVCDITIVGGASSDNSGVNHTSTVDTPLTEITDDEE